MKLAPDFAMGRDAKAMQERFASQLAPAIAQVGKDRLTPAQMQQCLREAALGSGYGRFVMGHNYWMLPGRGDAGAFLIVRAARDPATASGVRPIVEKYAKFSNLPQAIAAWCHYRVKR